MKQKIVLAIFAAILFIQHLHSQGFIYAHLKDINEESSPNYFFTLTNSSGVTVDTFSLNDQATANNLPLSGVNLYVYDLGLSHGTGGDGQLWTVAGSSWNTIISSTSVTGTVYYRNAGSAKWVIAQSSGTNITNARFIDGAYANQFVYSTTTGVYFYNNGTVTTLLSGGTNVGDVTCNNGRIAAVINGVISVYSKSYTTTAAPTTTGGSWSTGPSTGNTNTRIDMNVGATLIAYQVPGSNAVYTTGLTGTASTSVGSAGNSQSTYCDIAYDDLGTLYATAYSNTYGSDQIFDNTSGTTWNVEASSRDQELITGGAAHLVYSVNNQSGNSVESIFSRQTDNSGNIYWIDDERVKNSSSLMGNGVVIPVTPGTYTLTETLPSSSYDLGRYNIYDPAGGGSSGNVNTQVVTFVVSANEVVFGEYINEALNPKSLVDSCTTQYLQTFDASNSTPIKTYTYGNGTYGTQLEGTAYHYFNAGSPNDGYYYLTKTATGSNWFQAPGLSDHTGNGGYFLLLNASYAKDEFYRQRVTGLIPGLSYTISFWGANASPTAVILPNITYGLQDSLGNVVNSATTSNITGALNANDWLYFSFTFTATTSRADLFISNNAIGGNGNDLAIDDISLNPVLVPLPNNTVSPAIAPNICIGTNYTFSNSQSNGGTSGWTSSNTSAATINYNSGRAKGIAAGSAVITYTYTNAIGCVTTASTSIIVSAPPTVTATDMLGGTACLGQIDSLYSTASGTATPFTYLWSDPSGTGGLTSTGTQNTTVAPTVAGSYTFIMKVTDAVGCAGTANVALAVSGHTAPTVTTTGSNVCFGSAITNLKATPSGGSGIYTYAWTATPSSTSGLNLVNSILQSPSPTPTATGSYSYGVTVNDGFCSVPVKQAVTVFATPALAASSSPSGIITICKNGVIDLTSTPSGGTTSYNYLWTATGTGNGLGTTTTQNTTAQPTASGIYTYSVKLTDANGCTANASVTNTVTVNTAFNAPTVSASVNSSAVCSGSVVTLTGGITSGTGTSPYTYVWSGPSTIVAPNSGSTTATSYITTATPASAGNYTLTVTDTKGCIGAASTGTVAVNARPTVTASSYATTLCTNTKDTVYASASGIGALSYAWSVSAPSGGSVTYSPGATNATTGVAINTTTGNYVFTVTVTDAGANNCTNTASVIVANSSNTGPAISNMNAAAISCVGSTIALNPTVTNGTSGGITTTQLTPTATGGNNIAGCSSYSYAFDGNTSTIFADYSAGNQYTGWVYADLGAAYQITQITFTPTTGGASYMTGGVFYGTNTAPTGNFVGATTLYTISSTPSSGLNTVTSIASSTPFRYIIYQGPNSTGSYNLGGSCNYTSSYYSLVADIGIYTGSSSSTPVGIASYFWASTPTGNGLGTTNTQSTTATPTTSGTYTYTLKVTDNAGCVASANTGTQTINSAVTVSAQAITTAFCGTAANSTDQLYAIASGGSGTYSTYAWTSTVVSGAGTTSLSSTTIYNPVASITSATTASSFKYGVTVTDANGCKGTASTATIPVTIAPSVTSVTGTSVGTCANASNTITLAATFSAGTSPYNYTWTPPSNSTLNTTSGTASSAGTIKDTASATVAQNYSYSFTLQDANNCTASGFAVITVNPGLTIAANVSNTGPICANPATSVNLTSTVTGGTGAITYLWSGAATIASASSQNTTATPSATGVYTMTATDTKGCTGSTNTPIITVDQAPPNISFTCGTNSSGVNYANFYESNGTTWLWTTTSGGRFYTSSALSVNSDGTTSTLQSPFVTYSGTYSVQITDGNNCIGSGSYTLTSGSCTSVLAISGLNFVAVKQSNEALLTWSTLTEENNGYFNVERSGDGINWQVIGTVQAKGNSTTLTNYSFNDALPLNGTNYYRLKQVGNDGTYGYSPIRTLQFTGQWLVKLYPNPVQSFIVLEFNNDANEKASITIQSVSGSTIFTTEQPLVIGLNRITLNQVQFMAQGTYILTLGTNENVYRAKFVKGSN